MVPQPTKPVEILGNLGKVLSEGVLLKEQFYTEQNLLHAFGGKQVDWRSREARRLAGEVVDFRDIIPPVRDGTNTFAGMDLLFSRAVEDGNVTATLGMRFRANSGISFEQVEGLFGKNWQTVTRISQHPPAYTPPTKPGGNSRIVYTVPTTGGKAAVEMKFRPDASLAEVDVVTGSGSR